MSVVMICILSLVGVILYERIDILYQNIVFLHELIETLKFSYFESHDAVVDEVCKAC